MGSLSRDQIAQISQDIQQQGITFDPLREELLDHLICDIEIRMADGSNFNDAWMIVKKQIPENHFKHIQTETMELLNKKINPVRVLGILSFALLVFATLFKMLHFPGAGILLISFLIAVSVTLLAGSTRSVYVYREFRGRGVILLTTVIIISFIMGLCFKVLHLPGATELLTFAVLSLCFLFPALSIYFYVSKQKLKDYLLIRLIKDNQTILENTALTLIGFGLLFNYSSLLFERENFGGVIFFIFSIILTGMYVYTLTWKYYVEREPSKGNAGMLLLIFSSLAFIMFMLPVLDVNLDPVLRYFLAYTPGAIFCLITFTYYLKYADSKNRSILAALSSFLVFYPLLRLGTKLEWFEGWIGGLTTNSYFIVGFLIFLIALLVIYRKERLFKALIILTIASHMIPNL